jgi:hypothetical protein
MHEADHSSPYSAQFKNEWIYTSTPLCAFMTCTEAAVPLLYNLLQ